jgi:hypothetical protein
VSGDDSKDKRALVAGPDYEVGYGKPPKETRFKPGQSGNPRGRPKGAKNKRPGLPEERMKDIILDEAYRGITVRDGDRNVTIPMAQAVIRSMAVNAAKGQHRAQRLFAELLASVESSRKILHDQWLETAIEYKVEWEKELRRREQLGITDLPEPLPHPDHVKIDFIEGTAAIVGPATKEEKAEYDWFVERREMFENELQHLRDQRAEATDARLIGQLRRGNRPGPGGSSRSSTLRLPG